MAGCWPVTESGSRRRGALLIAVLLAGCSAGGTAGPEMACRDLWTMPEEVAYYVERLPDRSLVTLYGDEENPRPWYVAAEELGQIGKPAIPALMGRLDSSDPYEQMLALYALLLASQDRALMAETGGEALRLDTVLTEETNAVNRKRAEDWWQRHRHLWPPACPEG